MPVIRGLPTWLENGAVLICPASRPNPQNSASGIKPCIPLEPPSLSLADLKLPGEGETMSTEAAIQLMILGEYGIIQDYLDRHMNELFPPPS
jgi:hypothetical protein